LNSPGLNSLLYKLNEHWRISTFRLAVLFGFLFTVANVLLLGLVYWQTTSYL
jgi:hypothetical protein